MPQVNALPQDKGGRWQRILLSSLLLVLFALSFAVPARATPPRSASSSDQLLAANNTHFYVLRDLVDNRASYYSEFRDQYLVEIRFSDHKATRHWLLRRLTLSFEESTDRFTNWQEAKVAPVDLMAVLRANNAIPIRALNQSYQLGLFKMTFDALEPRGVNAATLSTREIGELARRQLNPLAANYGPDPGSNTWMGSQIAVAPLAQDPKPDCTILNELAPFLNGAKHLAGVRLDCWFGSDTYGSAVIYLFVPIKGY